MWSQVSLNPSIRKRLPILFTLIVALPITPVFYLILDEFLVNISTDEATAAPEPDPAYIVYNRVPRCGSRAVEEVIRRMASLHNYTFYRSNVFNKFSLTEDEQKSLALSLNSLPVPFVYGRPFYWIDLQRYSDRPVVYINLIRDPVEQAVSFFYSVREMAVREMSPTRRNMTMDQCVEQRDYECFNTQTRTVGFFCGTSLGCRLKGEESLAVAKKQVESSYSVVGITEDINGFLYLLAHHHPDLFTGAYDLYQPIKDGLNEKLRTKSRQTISSNVRAFLTEQLHYEYEFYNFVKKRLNDQLSVFHAYANYLKRNEIVVD